MRFFDKFDKYIKFTLLIYLILSIVLYKLKPDIMFTESGAFKQFGLGDKRYKTIFPFWLITTMMGIMVYYIILTCNNDYL